MLLAGAGLMTPQLHPIGAVDAGFDPHGVLTMRLVLTGSPHAATPERRNAFYREAVARVAAVPGVQSASGVNHLPLIGDSWTFRYFVEGRPATPPSQSRNASLPVAFPGYFQTMRIPVLRGRDFTAHDDAKSTPVVIVNRDLRRSRLAQRGPIGKRIRLGASDPWVAVVGVVKDVEQSEWGDRAQRRVLLSAVADPTNIQRYLTIVARTAGDPASLSAAIQSTIAALDRELPLADVLTMQQAVDRALWQPQILHDSSRRIRHPGADPRRRRESMESCRTTSPAAPHRHPHGAGSQPAAVLRSVLTQGAKLTLAGTAVGLAGALLLTRYLRTLLYNVSPNDPLALSAAAFVLTAVALLAVWLPARRATKIDPLQALRSE